MKKIAFVVQRFGANLIGGAEKHAYLLAQKISENPNHQVTVYTTTSKDYLLWDHGFEEGESQEGKIRIKRFKPEAKKLQIFFAAYSRVLFFILKRAKLPISLQLFLEKIWTRLQGPFTPSLVKALKQSELEYQEIFLFTYLYYPSQSSAMQLKNFIFIPTAHDEPPFYFHSVSRSLKNSKFIYANTASEADLIKRVHKIPENRVKTVGLGLELPGFFNSLQKTELSLPNPYILYLGRIGVGKGCQELLDFFIATPDLGINLVFAGQKDPHFLIPEHPHIHDLGKVSEEKKWTALKNATAVVCPSKWESLSLLTLEGILCKKPVLLTAKSKLFQTYAHSYKTVFLFDSRKQFSNQIRTIIGNNWTEKHQHELEKSKKIVLQTYGWDRILPHFLKPES